MFYEFNIPIEPVAKGRPRFAMRGKYATAYTPEKTRKYESDIKYFVAQNWKREPLTGPLSIVANFYFLRPKSVSAKARPYHVVKPDCSNLCKALEDSLNKILFHDDSQIIQLIVHKHYASRASIHLCVAEVGDHHKGEDSGGRSSSKQNVQNQ